MRFFLFHWLRRWRAWIRCFHYTGRPDDAPKRTTWLG